MTYSGTKTATILTKVAAAAVMAVATAHRLSAQEEEVEEPVEEERTASTGSVATCSQTSSDMVSVEAEEGWAACSEGIR